MITKTDQTDHDDEQETMEAPPEGQGEQEQPALAEGDHSDPEGEQEATDDEQETEPDTFPREYVEQLRKEAADARVRAKRGDDLGRRLHVALVAATGRLADPDDLPYDDAHLDDPEALTAALDALLDRKPHLASRRVSGGIGQGATEAGSVVDLAGLLRARA